MRTSIRLAVLAVLLSVGSSQPAIARKPYFEEFKEKYANVGGPGYAKLLDETKCSVCHVSEMKKERNSYGIALSKVIAKNEKARADIDKALGKIENEKSPSGETFIELIRQGKLPGANG
ncbi:MAG TPA: hypothetical protein VHC22_12210 [Pirellulales bacterium]|nr:hypothetical protein [Pirellulales bacterium]